MPSGAGTPKARRNPRPVLVLESHAAPHASALEPLCAPVGKWNPVSDGAHHDRAPAAPMPMMAVWCALSKRVVACFPFSPLPWNSQGAMGSATRMPNGRSSLCYLCYYYWLTGLLMLAQSFFLLLDWDALPSCFAFIQLALGQHIVSNYQHSVRGATNLARPGGCHT